MPETSVAYYEHYPVSPEDVIAHVVHIQTSTANISEVITQVQTDMATATAAVEGQLEGPLADAPVMVITMGAEVEATARHCCGCLLYFAQAIIDYDLGIDGLNQQILAALEAGTTPNPDSAVVRRKGQLDVTLDDEATLVAQMLGRGPNAQDAAFLEQEGAIVSDPLGSAHATPGSGAVLCRQASPEEAAAYWAALSPAERAAVIQQYPDVIGATDGLPAGARDEANRILLQRDLALPDGDPRRENAETVSASLTRIETEHFDPRTGQPVEAQLLIYDPEADSGDGRAAIVIGDADTADNVAFVVPGITNQVSTMPDQTGDGWNVYREAREGAAPDETTAVVVWSGYDEPDDQWAEATATQDRADDGGALLAASYNGLMVSRTDDPYTTVIGHSYGSTVVSYAVTKYDIHPDNVVFIGSPGAGQADNADDLYPSDVWVGLASTDNVDHSSVVTDLGTDPADDAFGATQFQAEVVNKDDGASGSVAGDHSRYLADNSESLYNITSIIVGDHEEVLLVDPAVSEESREATQRDHEVGRPDPPAPPLTPTPTPTPEVTPVAAPEAEQEETPTEPVSTAPATTPTATPTSTPTATPSGTPTATPTATPTPP